MNRLISIEGSKRVAIRIENNGKKCSGELSIVNVMYTMPVAFRIQALNKELFSVKPHSGIIPPLLNQTLEIIYHHHHHDSSNLNLLPDTFPYLDDDSFLLQSVVVPGASFKDDAVPPPHWFTTKTKHVFSDTGIKIIFVGSPILSHLVSHGSSLDQVRHVLEYSHPSWDPADSVDSQGRTLLHLAISQARPDLVQLILEFGPDLHRPCRHGYTPLEAASESGEALIVELLLARNASTERSRHSTRGPIHLASLKGHTEVLRLLILKGATLDALTEDGYSALHLAAEDRRRDCARLLLAGGAKADIRDTGEGNTALHVAAGLGDEGMVKLLLHKGANKEIRNKAGRTAYDMAAEKGHSRLFDALKLGDRLCRASRKGEVKTMRRVVENGAEIEGRDEHGWTALHRACFKGRVEAVGWLLERGVEVEAKDEEGYRALHCAAESGKGEVMELLVKKGGANVEARTNKGATAMQIAESLNYVGIIRILLQYHNTSTLQPHAFRNPTKLL